MADGQTGGLGLHARAIVQNQEFELVLILPQKMEELTA